MDIREAIDNLYKVFSVYSPNNMYYCDCGCVDPKDVNRLVSKKLTDLEEEDISSYHGSALYTWGGLEHYKFYLPRILEINWEKKAYGLFGIFEILQKLDYTTWEPWLEKEKKALTDYFFCEWKQRANCNNGNIGSEIVEYNYFVSIEDLIKSWDIYNNLQSLKNFVEFTLHEANDIFKNKGLIQKSYALSKDRKKLYPQFFEILASDQFASKLESTYFEVKASDEEFSDSLSRLLHIIEQEKRILALQN